MRIGNFRDAADAAQRLILAAVDTHAAAPQTAEKLTRIVPITQGFEAARSCEQDWKPTGIREIDELTAYFHGQLRESRPEDALPRQVEDLVSKLIDRAKGLTSSERVILRYYAEGYTVKEIPELLFISAGTVKGHNSHIYSKLGVDSYDALKAYLDILKRCGRLEELLQGKS